MRRTTTTHPRPRARRIIAAAAGATLLALGAPAAQAAGPCPPVDRAALDAPHEFRYGLTGDELRDDYFSQSGLAGDDYRPRRVSGYVSGSAQRFVTSWVKDGGPAWSGRFGLRRDSYDGPHKRFHTYYRERRADGYRPIDVSGYNTASGDVRYAALWERNVPHVDWKLHRDVSRSGMQALVDDYEDSDWVPSRIEGYRLDGQLRFISIWVRRACDWKLHTRMTRTQYEQQLDDYAGRYRLVHVDSYRDGSAQYYAGVWQRRQAPAGAVRTNRDWRRFQRHLNNLRCSGYVLDNAYATETAQGVRYGGIWMAGGAQRTQAGAPLREQVAKQVNCAPGRAGAVILNQMTGEQILVHPDQQFGTSSTIKSAILYALLRKIDREAGVTLGTKIDAGAKIGSNGPSADSGAVQESSCATSSTRQGLREHRSYSLRCLSQLMIRVSHNWATNRLIRYVGMAQINQELAGLGMTRTKLQRYMMGGGAPTAHGTTGPVGDYMAGWDNLSTPRDMATFMRRMHLDGALPAGSPLKRLTAGSNAFFWATLALDGGGGTNTKGYFPALRGSLPGWSAQVSVFNKPGDNPWGDAPDNKPGIGAHFQASEAGRLVLANGQVAFYAMFVDEADRPAASPSHAAAISCTGLAVTAAYSGLVPSSVPSSCG